MASTEVTIAAPLTTRPFGCRRTYPLAQLANVDGGTPTRRAASDDVYNGRVKRESGFVIITSMVGVSKHNDAH
jgi:hypothetical protein